MSNRKVQILIATSNNHKLEEFKRIFSNFPLVTFLSINDLENKEKINIVEDGKTFKENSIIKANELAKYSNDIIIADDSGLEIDSLDGFPGIYSARFMNGHPYQEKWQAVLDKMKDVKDRGAQFHCVITLKMPNQEPICFEGIERGKIVTSIHGLNGFGYDPIFYSSSLQKTFGDASEDEKNSCSHRGKAASKLKEYLINNEII